MALTPAALDGAENEVSTPGSMFRGDPIVRVGRRFLPVAAAALPPIVDRDGLVALPLAPGTPVHAVESGRVVSAEGATAGEIVIRIESELRIVYRKLLPSSVNVAAGDVVTAGDVIGTVAPSSGDRLVALELGVQNPDGSWEDLSGWLTGLPDPLELYRRPPGVQQRAATERRDPAASAQSPGFTVVKAQPDEPEPEPDAPRPVEPEAGEPAGFAVVKAPPDEPEPAQQQPEPESRAEPEIGRPTSGPEATELKIAKPELEPEPPEPKAAEPTGPATGASALTSRRRRGRPARPAPRPVAKAPEPAPVADQEPQPEPAAPKPRHMMTVPEPEPADRPEPEPGAGGDEARHLFAAREPGPAGEPEPDANRDSAAEAATPEPTGAIAAPLVEPEPTQAEPTPEVTVSVPDAVRAKPNSDEDGDASNGDETDDSDASRASKASRLTSRRQRPRRSRP